MDKEYEAEIFLGEERDTDDVEGKTVSKSSFSKSVNQKKIEKVLEGFIGKQLQIPPTYSAIKLKGKKAFDLARKGKEVNLEPRKVTIYSIELINYKFPTLNIKTKVSSGTYIRSLARDIGKKLETGAYLKNLIRTTIGSYKLTDSIALEKLTSDNWREFGLELGNGKEIQSDSFK